MPRNDPAGGLAPHFDGQSRQAPTAAPRNIDFPPKFQFLFRPKRYKVCYGGRGAGRSWNFARALLILGMQRPVRVLCVRELQNSLSDSVHKVLIDQIEKCGLSGFYTDVQANKIVGINGTTFTFEGIKNNYTKIKSYEGIDYCWVEEANKVSLASWETLIPTIRKDDSEIWISFNPDLESDYTYQRFVLNPPRTQEGESFAEVVKMTYEDNPYFPAALLPEISDLKRRDYDEYRNVYGGEPRTIVKGAIFGKELNRATEEGRITRVPYDRETPVDTFWDLGRRDATAIWFIQWVAREWRVLDYYEVTLEDAGHCLKELQRREYLYGTVYLPHDGKNKTVVSKRSVYDIVRAAGHDVRVVPRVAKKVNSINAARVVFPSCVFDERKCELGLSHLRRYRYEVNETGVPTSENPLHDEHSNAADAFQTFAMAARAPKSKSTLVRTLMAAANGGKFFGDGPGGNAHGWMGG